MLTRNFKTLLLLTCLSAAPLFTGCDDDDPITPPVNTAGEGDLTGNISGSRTLSADTTYTLKGFVFVQPGATLTIPAGTTVKGDTTGLGLGTVAPSALVTLPGSGGTPSGQLICNGTAADPIVFTSGLPEGQRDRGNWGGIVLMGQADVNVPGKKPAIEGITGSYGPGTGTVVNNDNSGTLRYVRIEYGGIKVSTDNEINGLTMGAVGTGTTIEYVQSHMIADDAFEWFGGTVQAKHLVASAVDDDMFDMDFGYSGKLQFLLGVQDPNLANRGFEVDNDGDGSDNTPYTNPTIANVTLIGTGKDKANNENNDGLYLRRNNRLDIYNALVVGFRVGLVLDGSSTVAAAAAGELNVKNSIFNSTLSAWGDKNGDSGIFDPFIGGLNLKKDVNVGITVPQSFPNINPIPNNEVANGAIDPKTLDSWFDSAAYIGAFAPNGTNWTSGWTNFKLS